MASPAPERPSAIPAPSLKRITDFESFEQLFSRWDGRFEQLTCGRFDGSLLVARGQQIVARLATANQALSIRGVDAPGSCYFSLVLPEAAQCLFQRGRLAAGSIVVRDGSVEVDHSTSKRAVNLSFGVRADTIHAAARTLNRIESPPISWRAVEARPELFAKLEKDIRRFLLLSQSPLFPGSQDARQLEQSCIRTAVEAAFPTDMRFRINLPFSSGARLTRLAEELMRARIGTPTGEIDLCGHLGVSGRTLRLAFRQQFGLGPMAYFQTLRLNAARTALKAANPESATVSAIAQSVGFSHLGKFSGYYRRLFAELPSQTVRRGGTAGYFKPG